MYINHFFCLSVLYERIMNEWWRHLTVATCVFPLTANSLHVINSCLKYLLDISYMSTVNKIYLLSFMFYHCWYYTNKIQIHIQHMEETAHIGRFDTCLRRGSFSVIYSTPLSCLIHITTKPVVFWLFFVCSLSLPLFFFLGGGGRWGGNKSS